MLQKCRIVLHNHSHPRPIEKHHPSFVAQCRRHEKMVAGRQVRNERNARTRKSEISFSPGGATEPFHSCSRTPPGCQVWWAHRFPVVAPPATISRPSGTKAVIRHVSLEFFSEPYSTEILGKVQVKATALQRRHRPSRFAFLRST